MSRLLCAAVIGALAGPLFAAGASHWVHDAEADFRPGQFQNTVASNLGDVKLSRAIATLLEQDARVGAVYALAEAPDGAIYAATGPQGLILKLKDGKPTPLATLPDENVFSLAIDPQGRLLAGTGGAKGRIFRVGADGKPAEIYASDAVQYVWAMVVGGDGTIYAGTGPNGQVVRVAPDGASAVLFDCAENNILSLIAGDKDNLLAGTDPNGLVYRIDRRTGQAFVLYDAPEPEISALAFDAKGNVFAATARAAEEGDEAEGQSGSVGRPRHGDGLPIPEMPDGPDLGPEAADADGPAVPVPSPVPVRAGAATRPSPSPSPSPAGGAQPAEAPEGNAIYRIDAQGFVTEVLRQPAMVLSLVESRGILIAGLGDGTICQVDPAAEETAILARLDARQVTALLPAKDGRVLLGLANAGGVAAMSAGHAREGTYASPALDATQIARFGKMRVRCTLPEGTALAISTRSGNVQEPSDQAWSAWSKPVPLADYVPAQAPPARFFQYRLHLSTTSAQSTPAAEQVDIAYQIPNLPPHITAVRVAAPEADAQQALAAAPAPSPTRTLEWEATDPNGDALVYTVCFRSSSRAPWIKLAERVKETQYAWDTRGVPDGQYVVRVEASDARDNPAGAGRTASRISDPIAVDNTAPILSDVKADVAGGVVTVSARACDRTSRVVAVAYSVNSKDDWQAVEASDKIFDSPDEGVSFRIENLAAGPHQVMLRASDDHGNQAYETIQVMIAPAGQ